MSNKDNEVYEHIVLGDGPISRTLVRTLNRSFLGKVLIVDAGTRIDELVNAISIESNISYDSHLRVPSLHLNNNLRVWYGGCQGWPKQDTLNNSREALPVSYSDPKLIKIFKDLTRELGFLNFNFFTNKVLISFRKKSPIHSANLISEFIFCKILRNPSLEKFMKINKKNKKNVFLSDTIVTKVIPRSKYVEVIGISNFGKKISLKGERLHMALGTIENTRLLLNSSKELNLSNNQYLGKFLSDHLSISISEVKSFNIAKVIRDFSRSKTIDGSLLWPRIIVNTDDEGHSNLRSFAHASHFSFYAAPPLIYRFLKKIGYANYYYSNKEEGSFQLNFLFEKSNSAQNSITLKSETEFEIPHLVLKFEVEDSEIQSYSRIASNYINFLHKIYSLKQSELELLSIFNKMSKLDYQTSVHQSGTYRMSLNPKDGVVNTNSELWGDSRIRVLGAGVLPRSSATHPTLISMVLSRLIGE